MLRAPAECPVCGGDVPTEIVRLRGTFDCPICSKPLRVSKIHALVIRLTAVAVGFLLARGAGFEGLLLFCFGLMASPFLIVPLWRLSIIFKRPSLVSSDPAVTTLSLTGK
jgi:hypothetical protein